MTKVNFRRMFAVLLSLVLVITYIPVSPAAQLLPLQGTQVLADDTEIPIYQDKENYSFEERAADMVARMTTTQKVSQTINVSAAIPELGISSNTWWNEAIHGYSRGSNTGSSTSYPVSYSAGSSWDPELYYKEASEIGDEARERTTNNNLRLTFYSPTVNLSRDPRWGRNDESYSEDPYLTAVMGSSFVKGMEGKDLETGEPLDPDGYLKVVSTLKHYTANNSERNRTSGGAPLEDLRSLREYYAAAYRDIIESADVTSVMTAYSTVNGVPVSMSSYLMDTMLRQTWGFSGYITSDCDSVSVIANHQYRNPHTGKVLTNAEIFANALAHGEDLECNSGITTGNGSYSSNLSAMLNGNITTDKGKFTENQLDVTTHRLMAARMKLGEFDGATAYVQSAQQRVAEEPAIKGLGRQTQDRLDLTEKLIEGAIVLLKNDAPAGGSQKLLPVDPASITSPYKIVIIGQAAQSTYLGLYSATQTNTTETGSNFVTIERGIRAAFAGNNNVEVSYYKGFTDAGAAYASLLNIDAAAVAAAADADLAIVVAGTNEQNSREDGDRTSIVIPGAQAQLISAVGKANKNTLAIMETCGPMQVTTFEDDVAAILWSSFGGIRKGIGYANVITGKVNPSGKTTALWHKNVNDEGVSDIAPITDYYLYASDDAHPGRTYMYYEGAYNGGVSYPFGYGLSYTTFEYSNISINKDVLDANEELVVSFDLKNTGDVKGAEVAQLYIAQPGTENPNRPIKRLFGFDKVTLEPGATQRVTMKVAIPDIAYFDEAANKFAVDKGDYQVQVGGCSAGVMTAIDFEVTGTIKPLPKFVTAKPNQDGDDAKGIAERLIFGKGRTVSPNIAVAMNDESLYGRTIVENVPGSVGVPHISDIPLPEGAVVSYSSNRPNVVSVDGGVIKTLEQGVATITASVSYNGETATGDFIVYVQSEAMPENILVGGEALESYAKDRTNYSIPVAYGTDTAPVVSVVGNGNPSASWEVIQADAIPGVARVIGTDAATSSVYVYTIGFGRPPQSTDFKLGAPPSAIWHVLNPASGSVESTVDGLKIAVSNSGALGTENPPKNIYLQQAAGDWAAKTHIKLSSTLTVNNQQAGLAVYDDDLNYIRFVYERPATGANTVLRVYRLTNGVSTQAASVNLNGLTDYYMQIVKSGDDYSCLYSTDEVTWTPLGAAVNARFALPQLGLWAINPTSAVASSFDATYEYLDIYGLEYTQPHLDGITIDGEALAGFDPATMDYAFDVSDFTEAPVVAATPADGFTAVVEQVQGLPGKAVITVNSGIATVKYYVVFSEAPTGDSFVDGTRDDKWVILNELESAYSIEKGKGLILPTQNVDIYQTGRAWYNAFIRPGGGNWEVVSKVLYPRMPDTNYQQFMLLVWQDEDNYIKLDCETSSLSLQAAAERNGGVSKFGGGNAIANADGTVTLYFRISKDGDTYLCSYSRDGLNYTELGSTEFHMVDVQIGLFATKNSTGGTVLDTYCEYLDVTWINGVEQKSYMQMLQDAVDNVLDYVVEDIPATVIDGELPLSPVPRGYTISLDSSNTDLISNDGVVTAGASGGTVELGISITDGTVTAASTVTLEVGQAGPYTVTFDSAGGSTVAAQIVPAGGYIEEPATPTMDGSKFLWWSEYFSDEAFDFSAPVYDDVSLVARWSPLATYIQINPSVRLTIRPKETYPLVTSTDGEEYEYVSSNPSIAKVDENGVITGVRSGTAIISVRTTDGTTLSSSATVMVRP
ncbi:MAG: glycoside hydrolase family 3 C-terminal domain-containing protein [Clostridiales Family XIII bacterium]|jgi:beta-glucosidase|nr:glycoside hydrolase family 3 C-terminal domain-containing protein [Clostridiales Family XIII bacterium]